MPSLSSFFWLNSFWPRRSWRRSWRFRHALPVFSGKASRWIAFQFLPMARSVSSAWSSCWVHAPDEARCWDGIDEDTSPGPLMDGADGGMLIGGGTAYGSKACMDMLPVGPVELMSP